MILFKTGEGKYPVFMKDQTMLLALQLLKSTFYIKVAVENLDYTLKHVFFLVASSFHKNSPCKCFINFLNLLTEIISRAKHEKHEG